MLTPLFESGFSTHSYGFREGRNAHQAVRRVEACWKEGRRHVVELAAWVRRRVRLYYWKQWKQPRTRRRHLLALGIPHEEVHLATRSRKGYWRMSANSIIQRAQTNRWLHDAPSPFGLRRHATGRPRHAHIMDYPALRANLSYEASAK